MQIGLPLSNIERGKFVAIVKSSTTCKRESEIAPQCR